MITLVEARNFRCLKYLHQSLENFQVLIGANGSGKTTFLDVVNFLGDIVKDDVDTAIRKRVANYSDLTFSSQGGDIELAIEAKIPSEIKLYSEMINTIRYEIQIGLTENTKEHRIKNERVFLLTSKTPIKKTEKLYFPEFRGEIPLLTTLTAKKHYDRLIINKNPEGNDRFYNETSPKYQDKWMPSFKFGEKNSALKNVPSDKNLFPSSSWLKEFIIQNVQLFIFDSLKIRQASPPGQSEKFKTDGSNLPWIIDNLKKNNKHKFDSWLEHVCTALPDIKDIEIIERQDDKHKYLNIIYSNDIKVPSWLASDGTLRLLALTLIAYLPNFSGVYLIEEPENGIHPKAIESVVQSLSSVYNAQILLASHSPVILNIVNPNNLICFSKTSEGITDTVKGNEHPLLKDWKTGANLSILHAGGLLG